MAVSKTCLPAPNAVREAYTTNAIGMKSEIMSRDQHVKRWKCGSTFGFVTYTIQILLVPNKGIYIGRTFGQLGSEFPVFKAHPAFIPIPDYRICYRQVIKEAPGFNIPVSSPSSARLVQARVGS
jgi:hypothetical protein